MLLPKLTIIIPTVKRPGTLHCTLKTVLNQAYANYSIIVSDNFSNDNTAQVVESFADSRIKYINPGKRLSMSHHWEFALEQVDDGYVTILGDDDGMLPNALPKVAHIIQQHKPQAIGWRFGNFNWKGLQPHFMIPMADYYRVVNARKEIERIFQRPVYNTIQFPSLYGGFIDISLIKQIKQRYGGRFFHSRIPDFFSGAMVAASVENYVRLEFPITINATSKHSTGYATVNKENDQTAFIDLQKTDGNIPFHKSLVFIRSNAVPITEAMLQVHELVPTFPKVNITRMLEEVISEANNSDDVSKFDELIAGVKQIGALNNIGEEVAELLNKAVYHHTPAGVKKKFSPVSFSLYVDTTNTDLNTVEDACNFAAAVIPPRYKRLKCGFLINYHRFTVSCRYLYLKYFTSKQRYL